MIADHTLLLQPKLPSPLTSLVSLTPVSVASLPLLACPRSLWAALVSFHRQLDSGSKPGPCLTDVPSRDLSLFRRNWRWHQRSNHPYVVCLAVHFDLLLIDALNVYSP